MEHCTYFSEIMENPWYFHLSSSALYFEFVSSAFCDVFRYALGAGSQIILFVLFICHKYTVPVPVLYSTLPKIL